MLSDRLDILSHERNCGEPYGIKFPKFPRLHIRMYVKGHTACKGQLFRINHRGHLFLN